MSANNGYAIEAEGLSKSFGEVRALDGLDLQVASGTVLGLLGPNGAGKTTAVRILTTLLEPDAGTARVAGHDVVREARSLRASIGLAGQHAAIDESLTGFENLEMVGRLYHLGRDRARDRAHQLLDQFALTDSGNRVAKEYSGGMARRLDLAAALVAAPPVIFLDEPTTGLDPRSRQQLWEAIREQVADGTTVLLTTQYLDEADHLADSIAVIDHGKLIAEGTSDELKRRVGGDRIEIALSDPADAARAGEALEALASEPARHDGAILIVPIRQRREAIARAIRALDAIGVGVEDIAVRRPTLDDVFIALTGRLAAEKSRQSEVLR